MDALDRSGAFGYCRRMRLILLALLPVSLLSARQQMDADFAKSVKEWTTKPEFISSLVDHLPKSSSVPSPKDILGHHIGAPKKLTYYADLVMYYRTHWEMLILILAAILGSFMVSYTTAKAEAMGVTPPRGSMRRAERAVYLLVGAGLTPFSRTLFADTPSHTLREFPIIFALALVAVVTNVSVVQRFGAIAEALRAKQGHPPRGRGAANDTGDADLVAERNTPASSI